MFGLPSVSNMFRPTQQVQQVQQGSVPGPLPTPTPANPAGGPAAGPGATMGVDNPGATNPNPAATNDAAGNSPLDAFTKLWETDPTAKPPVDPWSQPILPTDPAKLQQAAQGMNMLQGVDPAILQKVAAGGDPQAIVDLVQAVARNTMLMSANITTASVEKAGTTVRDRMNSGIEDRFQSFMLKQTPSENPIFDHPAAAPMLQMARQQIRMKNPNLSAAQIQKQAEQMLAAFGTAVTTSGQPNQSQTPGNGEQDWDTFLTN